MARFYCEVLGMSCRGQGEHHAVLSRGGFELVVHRVPDRFADGIDIAEPPVRREESAVRLDYPVASVERSRAAASSLGGGVDGEPPPWAGRDAGFHLGYDPEGNVFGVSQQPE